MTRRWWRLDDWFRAVRHDGMPLGGRSRQKRLDAPAAVRVAVGALVLAVVCVPLFVGLAFLLNPGIAPEGGQGAVALGVVLLLVMASELLLGHLLLRRSRLAWLIVVGTGVLGTLASGGVGPAALDALGRLLALATWLPLALPQSVRWYWQRSGARAALSSGVPSSG